MLWGVILFRANKLVYNLLDIIMTLFICKNCTRF